MRSHEMSANASQFLPPEKPDGDQREGSEPENAGDLTTLKEAFELTAKAAAALFGILYVCGLVVSALFLFPYGVYGLDLIRVHYVLAGLWILLPLLVIFLIVAMAIALFDALGVFEKEREEKTSGTARDRKIRFWRYAWRVILASVCIILCLYVVWLAVKTLSRPLGAESIAQEAVTAAFWMILRWLGGVIAILLLPFVWGLPPDVIERLIESISRRASVGMAFVGGFALLTGALYLIDFSQSVYSKLPMTLGGGRPVIARALIKPEAAAILELLKNGHTNTIQSGATLIVQIDLLLETSRGYFVRVSEHPPKAALIPREVVQGVILEGNATTTATATPTPTPTATPSHPTPPPPPNSTASRVGAPVPIPRAGARGKGASEQPADWLQRLVRPDYGWFLRSGL
jgi:uncharacterized membrane protein